MPYTVIINYSRKNVFSIKRKQGINNCFKPLILSAFTAVASRLKSEQKGKINLETKYNIQYSVILYKINENFSFSSNN